MGRFAREREDGPRESACVNREKVCRGGRGREQELVDSGDMRDD